MQRALSAPPEHVFQQREGPAQASPVFTGIGPAYLPPALALLPPEQRRLVVLQLEDKQLQLQRQRLEQQLWAEAAVQVLSQHAHQHGHPVAAPEEQPYLKRSRPSGRAVAAPPQHQHQASAEGRDLGRVTDRLQVGTVPVVWGGGGW